ncbi:MAG: hypothetical protein C4527_25030 [Candidatus Omnitrophota bacterium]|jgi:GH35 family endo-1,4-beta-xylanase|nr:MAG: hypothetical protein C4527_25030 [Candidatus Omnitrophota bacterium]
MIIRKKTTVRFLLASMLFVVPHMIASASDLETKITHIQQIKSDLEQSIAAPLPIFLKTMQNGLIWMRSLHQASQNVTPGQSPDGTEFVASWKSILQGRKPATIATSQALAILEQCAEPQKSGDAFKKALQLADELVLELEALDRIERNRRQDMQITVKKADGTPLGDASVQIRQIRHEFLFGCNIFRWAEGDTPANQLYKDRFSDLFNFATLGFYWAAYERREGETLAERWQKVAEWCKQHGITCKGHPLVWNYADPRWIPDDPKEVYRLQMERVAREVTRFAGLIDMWDVVNEATPFDRESFWERSPKITKMWEEYGQMDVTKTAFQIARKANPNAALLINDYYLHTREQAERDNSIRGKEREIYEDVIDALVDENGKRLYDVIGIQSHMHGGAWSTERILEVVKRFAKYGVPLHFTETTVVSGPRNRENQEREWGETTPAGEQLQAEEVERFYRTIFSCPEVEALTWWDFSDDGAWQRAPAGFLRRDMSAKPAYDKLMALVKDAWWTSETIKTNANGQAKTRGFTGTYDITIRAKSGETIQKTLTLNRSQAGNHTIYLD